MMNLLTLLVTLSEMLSYASSGSFYKLLNAEEDTFSATGTLFNEKFYQCDSEESCTHVAKLIDDNEFKMVYGNEALKNLPQAALIWAKVNKAVVVPKQEMTLLSRGKDTKQSSTHGLGASHHAVDGNRDNDYFRKSCFHTADIPLPHWWRVDTGQRSMVHNVIITNRGECCQTRQRNFTIRIGFDDQNGANPICREHVGISTSITVDFKCNNLLAGRYVYIESSIKEAFALCEVEVYGYYF